MLGSSHVMKLVFCTIIAWQCVTISSLCPSNWLNFENHCYQFNNVSATVKGKSWSDARAACSSYGGDLASILTAKEQAFLVSSLTPDIQLQHYWIGFNDRTNEGTYAWSDGSPVNYTNWNVAYGEPNNWGGDEDCGEVHHTGEWNDNGCFREFGYICKVKMNATLPTTSTPLPTPTVNPNPVLCEVGWESYGSSCYKFALSYRNWMEARTDCQTRGGDLVIINDAYEQAYLQDKVERARKDFWLGLSDNVYEGYFHWVNGDVPSYTFWGSGEPSNAFGGEDCVEMYSVYNAGTWNDNSCITRRPYICEKENGKSMCPEDWISFGDSCYQINAHTSQKKSWNAAQKSCRAFDGADLVTIDSSKEQAMIVQAYNDYGVSNSYFWTGLNDLETEGTFLWPDKATRNFSNWAVGQPHLGNAAARAYDCVKSTLSRKVGMWSTSSCSRRYYFVCERKREYGRCHLPLGMQDDGISDQQITASSYKTSLSPPSAGRLENSASDMGIGAWCAASNDQNQWLQIDVGEVHKIAFIAVQGKPTFDGQYVTSFYVTFGVDGFRWNNYGRTSNQSYEIIKGSRNQNDSVETELVPSLVAKYVRINPLEWVGGICMRVELYGCLAVTTSKCGDDWIEDPASGNCYQIGHTQLAWQNARANCLLQDADLVSISSIDEHTYIRSLVNNISSKYTSLWIGLNDRDMASYYKWSDGSPLSLVRWASGQPRDQKDVYDCVSIISSSGQWDEVRCNEKLAYICQKQDPALKEKKKIMTGSWIAGTDMYWPLDEVIDNSIVSGSKDGQIFGNVNKTSLPFNKMRGALGFDGASTYIDFGNVGGTCISAPNTCFHGLTISFLIRPVRRYTNIKGYVLDTLGQNPSDGIGISIYTRYSRIYFVIQTSNRRWFRSTSIRMSLWTHVVVTFGSGSGLSVFFNGFSRIKSRYGSSFPRGTGKESVTNLIMGRSASYNSSFAQMQLASFAVWNKMISMDDIQKLYKSEIGGCEVGWLPFGDNCYQFNSQSLPWLEAEQDCQKKSGNLVSISNSVQQAFVQLYVGTYGVDTTTWIGLNSKGRDHVYNWTDSTPISFSNWGRNEPNNYGYRREDCVDMWRTGFWNDELCWSRLPFACIKGKGIIPRGQQQPELKSVKLYQYRGLTIGCPLGTRINLESAFYGNLKLNCSSNSTLDILRKRCDRIVSGRSCYLSASVYIFGDPCPRQTKELYVNYTCADASASLSSQCPRGWYGVNGHKSCYKMFYSKKTWDDASLYCKRINPGNSSQLVSIASTDEQAIVSSLFVKAINSDSVWIGLNDKASRGVYQWSDGSPVMFSNWINGQPDDSSRQSSCASIRLSKVFDSPPRWSDEDCSNKNGFICEMLKGDTKPMTTVSTTESKLFCRPGWTRYKGKCYKISNERKSWLEARNDCQNSAGNLVSIGNADENEFLFKMMVNASRMEMWLGLTDKGIFRGQFWSDNSPVSYTKWDALQPNSYLNQLSCSVMGSNGYWKDEDCNLENIYACKGSPFYSTVQTTPDPSITTLASTTQDPSICLENYILWKENGMCYYFSNSSMQVDWHQAKKICADDGGTLTSIINQKEHDFLNSQMLRKHATRLWIGLSDFAKESGFQWVDGSPLTYINYQSNQPDDWQQMEDCVAMEYSQGKWNDKSCSLKIGFICKTRNNSAPVPPTTAVKTMEPDVGSCESGWYLYGKKCYQINIGDRNRLTWQQARNACRSHADSKSKADLVSIHSSFENAFLLSHLGISMESVFIGLNDLQIERSFTWSDQSSTNYVKWFRRQPDNYAGGEDCVELMPYFSYKGAWNDMRCDSLRGYVCQKDPSTSNPSVTPTTNSDCPTGYMLYDKNCYSIKTEAMSWQEAQKSCKKDHEMAELASLHTPHEQAFLFSYFAQKAKQIWIGLIRGKDNRIFKWSDKTKVDFTHWGTVGIYQYKDYCTHSDVSQNMEGRWIATDCTEKRAFACKITKEEEVHVPEYPGNCSSGWHKLDKHCYYVGSGSSNYLRARKSCLDFGGDLTSIHSKKEQDFIHYLTRASFRSSWLGLTDQQSNMKFQWSDGSNFDYQNWNDKEPNNKDGNENCVDMDPQTGKWNDLSCSTYLPYVCKKSLECSNALVSGDAPIPDESITASTSDGTHFPALARMNTKTYTGWCSNVTDVNQYLQFDLGTTKRITKIAIKGVRVSYRSRYVQSYRILYSNDGIAWNTQQIEGRDLAIPGNQNSYKARLSILQIPVAARYLRINPLTWYSSICMKIELYGCNFACENPLGLEKHAISDKQMSAASTAGDKFNASAGRLNNRNGAWCSKDNNENQWLQIHFKSKVTVSKIATQGLIDGGTHKYVSAYKLSYSDDMKVWTTHTTFAGSTRIFGGNGNGQGTVIHRLTNAVSCQYLRIQPLAWVDSICMRTEVYGCFEECKSALGIESEAVPSDAMSASSYLSDFTKPAMGRLTPESIKNVAWCAKKNDKQQFLQVDFGSMVRLTAIVTQGLEAIVPKYVTAYQLQYSLDGVFWNTYQSSGVITMFLGNRDGYGRVSSSLPSPIKTRLIRINPVAWFEGICMRLDALGCFVEALPTDPPIVIKQRYKGSFRITNIAWSNDYLKESSSMHQKLENDIKTEITDLYINDVTFNHGLQLVEVEGFKKGSVIVSVVLSFTTNDEDSTLPLKKAVKSGTLGRFNVDSFDFEAEGSTGKATKHEDDTGISSGGKIALIVVFIALIAIVVAGGAFWFHRRRSSYWGPKPQQFENPIHFSSDTYSLSGEALIDS